MRRPLAPTVVPRFTVPVRPSLRRRWRAR